MPPRNFRNDVVDSPPTDSIINRQRSLGDSASGVSRADFQHLRRCQNCHFVLFAVLVAVSSLVGAVSIVVPLCSQEQMVRAHTGGVIALVAHAQSLWDGTTIHFPRNTAGAGFSFPGPDVSVPIAIKTSNPNPTLVPVRLAYFLPESFRKGATWEPSSAYAATAFVVPTSDSLRVDEERSFAVGTDSLDRIGCRHGRPLYRLVCVQSRQVDANPLLARFILGVNP